MTCINPGGWAGLPGSRLTIPTHVDPAGGQTVHPSIVHVPGGWNGYEYWMAHTPYPGGNDDHEDPNVVASHDGVTWEEPDGITNPLDDQPGSPGAYNSDVDLKLVGGIMYVFWRTYDQGDTGQEERLYYRTSEDGVTWTPKVQYYQSDRTVRRLLSPTLLFEGGRWVMWAVDIVPEPHHVVRLVGGATPEDPWSEPVTVDVGPIPEGQEPWHIYVTRIGDCLVGLLNSTNFGQNGFHGDLFLIVSSDDGLTWTNSGGPIVPRVTAEYQHVYHGTLLPDGDGFRVWYSTADRVTSPSVWNVYRTLILAPTDPDPGDPGDPGVQLPGGTVSPVVQWLGCDLVTGRVIADLPDMRGEIGRLLGAYTSASLTLPIPLSGPGALGDLAVEATTPGRTMIVAVVNDEPAWGGMVLARAAGTEAVMQLGTATLESYLSRRRVRDHDWSNTDEAVIMAELARDADDMPGIGSGIRFEIDAPPTGTRRDRVYVATDRATVYDRMRELSAVAGGPEWTIELLWGDDTQTWVRKVLRIRKRIGIEAAEPSAIFETTASSVFDSRGGNEARYQLSEDYSDARGANYVIAYSSGEGDDQPVSAPAIDRAALAAGWPIYERHWQPSSSITNVDTLNAHAMRDLQLRRNGARVWEITARWNVYPRLNVDLRLGDDVGWILAGHRHPKGVTGQGRMIGWTLNPDEGTFSPTLLDPSSDEGDDG